jgi:hypothetical protein
LHFQGFSLLGLRHALPLSNNGRFGIGANGVFFLYSLDLGTGYTPYISKSRMLERMGLSLINGQGGKRLGGRGYIILATTT